MSNVPKAGQPETDRNVFSLVSDSSELLISQEDAEETKLQRKMHSLQLQSSVDSAVNRELATLGPIKQLKSAEAIKSFWHGCLSTDSVGDLSSQFLDDVRLSNLPLRARQMLQQALVAAGQGSLFGESWHGPLLFEEGSCSAGVSVKPLGLTLPQLEQFSRIDTEKNMNYSSKFKKSLNSFLDSNILMVNDTRSNPFESGSGYQDNLLCKTVLQNFSQKSSSTAFCPQKVENLSSIANSLPVSDNAVDSNIKPSEFCSSAAVGRGNSQNNTYADAAAPKLVSDSIPMVGSTPDCGIIMQKVSGTFLEDYARAIVSVAGPKSIVFLGRAPDRPGYMMAFLVTPKLVERVVQQGVKVRGTWICVTHLQEPATKVIVSGVLPFISDSQILAACKPFAKPVYGMLRRIPAAVKSSQFSGILSFRREMQLIMNKDASLPEGISVYSHGEVHKLELSTTGMKCFRCLALGHAAAQCKTDLSSRPPKNKDSKNPVQHLPTQTSTPPPTNAIKVAQVSQVAKVKSVSLGPTSLTLTPKQGDVSAKVSSDWQLVDHKKKKKSVSAKSLSQSDMTNGVACPSNPYNGQGKTSTKFIGIKSMSSVNPGTLVDDTQKNRSSIPVTEKASVFVFRSKVGPEEEIDKCIEKKARMSSVPMEHILESSKEARIEGNLKSKKMNMKYDGFNNDAQSSGVSVISLVTQSSPLICHPGTQVPPGSELLTDESVANESEKKRRRKKASLRLQEKESQDMEISLREQGTQASSISVSASSLQSHDTQAKKFLVVKKSSKPSSLDPNHCLSICQDMLEEINGLKASKKKVVAARYLSKYPDLLQVLELGQSRMLNSQPGSQVYKALVSLRSDLESLSRSYNIRSTKKL